MHGAEYKTKATHPTKLKEENGGFSCFTAEEIEPEASQPGLLDILSTSRADWKTDLKHVHVWVYLKKQVGFTEDRFGMLGRLLFKTLKNNRKKKTAKSKVYK